MKRLPLFPTVIRTILLSALIGGLAILPAASAQPPNAAVGEVRSNAGSAQRVDAQQANVGRYYVGVGDVLSVSVWKNDDLGGEFAVLPDGTITVPLIGQVQAAGRSPLQIRTDVTVLFEEFITAPAVSVAVSEINSRKVYVLGQVNEPGAYDLQAEQRLLQVLATAGGLTDFAKKDEIILLRTESGQAKRYQVSLKEIMTGRRLQDNFLLSPGDTIVVP